MVSIKSARVIGHIERRKRAVSNVKQRDHLRVEISFERLLVGQIYICPVFFMKKKKLSSVDYSTVILVDLNFMCTKVSGCSKILFIVSACLMLLVLVHLLSTCLKITKIDDTMATIMITMYHQDS